ncbi:YbaY family lipoprotein [Pseudomonas viridiflava]|jgi:Uncharacterized protein conserved in bacteria|uniref:Lipoprotein n=1 Tax=Pseudomonas viridiflava TaxID=33069 RepID=A0AA46ZQE0_PSEVI|nr:YbaY family lipoprotein [Pseudomonas viridiflava]MBV1808658.1 YbaY family lipoprotein [Pseudomonas viridiflava]MEE4084930.1 YbaY family lipoprotein [Pseudomonas viridiflava]MEE4130444.1 YbaY family lipoprotein [Pseudomonas viridiflava]QXG24995.1 YbaY family lipoprotein [Pseudomonas viridiflava]UZA70484.1 hypothetical protein EZZ81_20505 [Pseudomonas viridiflava]
MSSEPRIRLQGEVYYLPRIALPEGCTLIVKLEDISRVDAAADVIAVSEQEITHQVPLPFELSYVAHLHPQQGHTYALSARIEHAGQLLWINDTSHAVELADQDQSGLKIRVIQA